MKHSNFLMSEFVARSTANDSVKAFLLLHSKVQKISKIRKSIKFFPFKP